MRFGILGNPSRDRVASTVVDVIREIRRCYPGSEIVVHEDTEGLDGGSGHRTTRSLHEIAETSDTVISIGGDGSMLVAARAILNANHHAQLLGINVGKLGFLSENPPSEIAQLLSELQNNELRTEPRLMLDARIRSETEEPVKIERDAMNSGLEGTETSECHLSALNDIVIDNYGSTRMLTLEVFVDNALLGVMRADGIIIATPTGSTGYAVSAGGPIVEPTSRVMLITPIAPHSLNVRPIIVPEDCTISVRASSEETKQALVVADGQEEVICRTPALVTVVAAKERLKLLRRKERSYFDLLRHKLLWSMDQRDNRRY